MRRISCIATRWQLALVFLLPLVSANLSANTSGVHGPNVNADDRSMQLRLAFSPADSGAMEDNWASRLHYQHAFSDRWRGRVILQVRDRGDFQYDYLRTELLYNFKKKNAADIWSSGIRFDLRTRRGDRPEEFAVNWTNQWDLDNGIRVRGILIASNQFNSDSADSGIQLTSRASISGKLDNGLRIGMEMFNDYGKTGDFGGFNQQSHQIGPMIGGKIDAIKYEFRYLFGITGQGRDHNLGLRFNYAF